MPYDGSGNFTRIYNWTADRNADIRIQAARMDGECNDYASAFNQVMLRSGVAAMTGNLNMGQQRVVSIAPGSEGAPGLTFFGDNVSGLFLNGVNNIAVATNGLRRLEVRNANTQVFNTLLLADAGFRFASDGAQDTGMSWASDGVVNFLANGVVVGGYNSGGFTGNLTGSLIGNVTGNVTGNVSGTAANVTGVVAVANGGTGVTTSTGSGANVLANSPTFVTGLTTPTVTTTSTVALAMSQNSAIRNTSSAGTTMFFDSGVGAGSTSGDFDFRATAGYVSRLYIRGSDGFVGIGTFSPATRLQVVGSVTAAENVFTVTGGVWFNAANTFTRGVAADGTSVAVYSGGAGRVWVSETGAVGIGTNSAQSLLHVTGAARFGPASGTAGVLAVYNDGNDATIEAFAANNPATKRNVNIAAYGGNVGIGTNNPASRFSVAGGDIRISSNARGLVFTDASGTNPQFSMQADNNFVFYATDAGGNLRPAWSLACRNNTAPLQLLLPTVSNSTIDDNLGNVRRMVKAAATSGVLTSASANQWVRATGGITLNNSVFAANDWLTIVNKSGGAITITQGAGLTLTDAFGATGNRTLANHGICTVIFNAANDAIISGTGLT